MASKAKYAEPSPAVQFTPVWIAGKPFRLAFSFNGLIAAERELGENLLSGIAKIILGGMSATQYRSVLYAALKLGHPEIDIEGVGRILEAAFLAQELGAIQEALLKCYGISFQKTEVPPEADPPAEKSQS